MKASGSKHAKRLRKAGKVATVAVALLMSSRAEAKPTNGPVLLNGETSRWVNAFNITPNAQGNNRRVQWRNTYYDGSNPGDVLLVIGNNTSSYMLCEGATGQFDYPGGPGQSNVSVNFFPHGQPCRSPIPSGIGVYRYIVGAGQADNVSWKAL